MDISVLVALAGLIFAVITYFLGLRRGRQERLEDRLVKEEQNRRARIEQVAERYVGLACSHPPLDSGPHALVRAGIKDLRNDAEIRDALRMITTRVGTHPLGHDAEKLRGADLKAFFEALEMGPTGFPNYSQVLQKFMGSVP